MSVSTSCCTIPPVEAEYTPKGSWGELAGIKSYFTGPTTTGKALLFLYDIFGLSPQILQGADLLAAAGYRVAIPDFFEGKSAQPEWFTGTPEGDALRAKFFESFPGKFETQSERIGKCIAQLKAEGYAVGTVGFCWGWKAIVLAEGINDVKAIAAAHPSRVDVSDAERVSVPVALLPSGGEDAATMQALYDKLEEARPGQNLIKFYSDQRHGWAAARGDLKGGPATEAFRDAYVTLADFFKSKF